MKLYEIMSRHMITCDVTDFVVDAAKKMKKNEIGFLPIVQDQKIVGVITDRDIVIHALANSAKQEEIASYMTHHIISIASESSLEEALKMMRENKVKRLLVTQKDAVVGIVSIADFLQHIKSGDDLLEALKEIDEIAPHETVKDAEIDEFYL